MLGLDSGLPSNDLSVLIDFRVSTPLAPELLSEVELTDAIFDTLAPVGSDYCLLHRVELVIGAVSCQHLNDLTLGHT
jgi:hypothetical protein